MQQKIRQAIHTRLWDTDLGEIKPVHAWLIRMLRILLAVGRDMAGGLPALRAMGLVYTTLLSLVPLLAVSFSILKGFGVHNQLEPTLLSLLEPLGDKGAQVTERIISFVDNVDVRVLGSLSLVFLLYTVISLLTKIEQSINYTWHIHKTRGMIQRISQYISIVMIGPVMIFTAIGLTTSITRSDLAVTLAEMEALGFLITLAGKAASFILIAVAIMFIYLVVPNTRVQLRAAAAGAIAATILWKITGWIFTSFITGSTSYSAIYSSFAVLILFMIWLYLSWLILLIGAGISFYYQYPERTTERQQVLRLSSRMREQIALLVMLNIGRAFHHGEPGPDTRGLARRIDIAEEALKLILHPLADDHLIVKSADGKERWLPGQSLEHIRVATVWDSIRRAEETVHLNFDALSYETAVSDLLRRIEHGAHTELGETTVLKLIQQADDDR